MENSIGSFHEVEIPRKSRSLDLKSLYQSSKGLKEPESPNLKRKGGSGVDKSGDEKKRKRLKSVSVASSNRKVNGSGSKSLEEVYNGSLSSVLHGVKNSKSGLHDAKDVKPGLLSSQNDTGFSGVSRFLKSSFDQIPRRKRDFVGRKKVNTEWQALQDPAEGCIDAVASSEKVKATAEDAGAVVEPQKVESNKAPDESKEESNSETNSGRHDKEEDGYTANSASTSVVLSLRSTGGFLKNKDDSSKKKSLRKRSRKRKDLKPEGRGTTEVAEPSIDAVVKASDNLHDEDEENLEENAARMLSSRFDPSCMGFSSNNKALSSSNGLPLLSSDQEFNAHGANYVSGSESAYLDAAARVLRPRKDDKGKGSSRKRRHYYEILSGDLDANWVLNRRIKVFWPLDQSWYYGLVSDYDKVRKLHHVKYDDRDEEWINLQDEKFKLLLLPSEVPGKPLRRRSRAKERRSEKGEIYSRKEMRDKTSDDDSSSGNHMDSAPIISWLARTTCRAKTSPLLALKKQKISVPSASISSISPEEDMSKHKCLDGDKVSNSKIDSSDNSGLQGSSSAIRRNEGADMGKPSSSKDGKLPVVYYRRRFRNANSQPNHVCRDNCVSVSAVESSTAVGPAVITSKALGGHDTSLASVGFDDGVGRMDRTEALWLTSDKGQMKLNNELVSSRELRFELTFPLLPVSKLLFGADHSWFCHALVLLQHGTLMAMWPRVQLEMLFVDNVVGLRFLLFEGCLKQAIAFVLQVLAVFHEPTENGKFVDLQLPVTSIKCKLSCIQDFRKQLVFAFYNFSEVKSSKWLHLDSRLTRHCLLAKQLPLSECTYDNVMALQIGTGQLVASSISRYPTIVKGPTKRFRQRVGLVDISSEVHNVNSSSSLKVDKSRGWFPPFALSFSAAPTFFLGLHLKLLMEHSATHISFQDHGSVEHPENSCGLLADVSDSNDDFSNKCSESTRDKNFKVSSKDADRDEFSTKPEYQAVRNSANSCGDCLMSSLKHQNGDVDAETSPILRDSVELERDNVALLGKWQYHHLESEQFDAAPKPSFDQDKDGTGSNSLLNGIRVEIPLSNQFDKHDNKELHSAQQSIDLSSNMSGGIIPSPNPTARRSTWHRNRSNSTPFGYHAHGWSDGKVDFLHNNFGNGPKKPRTQVSYAVPFGGFDYSSKGKGHSPREISHKRIRTASEKKSTDLSRGSNRNLELLSCEANVLITVGDRGWREHGARVLLELFDHNEWKLAVKLSGTTKYSYKAHQFLQPGSTNRYTHAMMWKGGKDWILEFSDRSQWSLFKEMHEECYNRNIHSASVKNIPIPGVRLIEEHDENGIEVPFVRYSSKYFRQLETDVDMALDPSRVLYDIDSDDEQWLTKNLMSSEAASSTSREIFEEIFEKTMDRFEKAAYTQRRDLFTSDEIDELMAGVGSVKVTKHIYEYWQQKRRQKGMPLIRHLQPPLWERYQQHVKDWELRRLRNNTTLPNGCHGKVVPIEKPPMFAFCLKPRGLEVLNKGSKQRSHRKISVSGQRNTFSGDHDGFHPYGRRLNGFSSGYEKGLYHGYNYEPLDDSQVSQISPRIYSPQDAGGKGYLPMIGDRYDRTHIQKLHWSKSRKSGAYVFPSDTQMVPSCDDGIFDKRNGFHRWNSGFSDWASQHHYYLDGPPGNAPEQSDALEPEPEEFRLHDASGAAQHARNIAKFKRERAQRLLYRADLAIHRAVVALMTAEAVKVSSVDPHSDG